MKGHADEQPAPTLSTVARTVGGFAAAALLALAVWRYPFAVGAAAVLAFVLLMHEFGHFATARAVGMKVTDFFLGFGPRLWSFQRGETTYGLRALPLGAYVRVIGMSASDEVEPGEEDRAYRAKSYPRRLLVVCAGSLMHLVMAMVALLFVHAVLGVPSPDDGRWQVAEVTSQREGVALPAGAAGISPGDRILSVEGVNTEDWNVFVSQVQARPGETVQMVVERDDTRRAVEATLAADPVTGSGLLGVRATQAMTYETSDLLTATGRATADLGRAVVDSVRGIWSLFANFGDLVDRIISPPGDPSVNEDLGTRPLGVVGIVDLASDAQWEWSERLLMFAVVNVFFAVFNMLPVPPFDGGHVAVATYERWRERGGRGRYLSDSRALSPVVAVVVTALGLLAVGLLYLDIANPINL